MDKRELVGTDKDTELYLWIGDDYTYGAIDNRKDLELLAKNILKILKTQKKKRSKK